MRIPMIAAAVLVAAAPAPAQAPANPYATVRMTPSGSIVHGSPSARVKLVEWFSMTCPHCAHFSDQAGAELDRRIRAGTTSVEYRHFVFNPLDLAASLAARCGGAARFPANARALFASQGQWIPRAQSWAGANQASLAGQTQTRQLQLFARGAGLYDLMRARGYTPARLDACIADPAEQKRLAAMTVEARKLVQSTPSFAINGGTPIADVHGWDLLAPRLVAAGSR